MSYRPHALGFFLPTGCVSSSEFSAYQATSLSESGNGVDDPARAAYSHSASVGRRYRYPSFRSFKRLMKSWASSLLTVSTGRSPPLIVLGLEPITLSHCACVTSYFPISIGLVTWTGWVGFSSALHSLSPTEQPIANSPGAISTNSIPIAFLDSFGATREVDVWASNTEVASTSIAMAYRAIGAFLLRSWTRFITTGFRPAARG